MADIEKIKSLRVKFSEAIDKKDLYYAEIGPDLKNLELKGSVLQKIPTSNEDLELSRSWVKSVKALKKSVESHRMDATKPLDELKDNMILEQRGLFTSIDPIEMEVTRLAQIYVAEEDKKKKEAEAKALREKNKSIEKSVLIEKIKNSATTALAEEVMMLNRVFSTSWASLTLKDFDSRIAILKGYKPKVEFSKLLKYFDYNYQYITPDEFEGLLRATFDFNKFEEEILKAVENTKKDYLAKADTKKKDLESQSDAERERLIQENKNAEIHKEAQLIVDKEKKEEALREKEADIKLEIESSTPTVIHNGIKNVNRNKVAYISGVVDWNKIVNIWISENGTDKLGFLLANLQRKGCPDIDGISYKDESKLIFK
jgi:hypothetical protein